MGERGTSAVWWTSAGRCSLRQLLVSVGECDKGQEDQTRDAANEQAQQAAMYMHGLTPLPCVEKGVPRDAPVEQDTENENHLDLGCFVATHPTNNSNNSSK